MTAYLDKPFAETQGGLVVGCDRVIALAMDVWGPPWGFIGLLNVAIGLKAIGGAFGEQLTDSKTFES